MIPKADLKATARARLETKHLAEWSVILDWDPEKRYHATGLFTEQQARDIVTAATKLLSTLVVSAPWLEQGKLKALGEFTKLLSESIGEESLREFSRIATVSRRDPALDALVSAFSVDDGELRVKRSNLFGLEIEDAIILRAKRAA